MATSSTTLSSSNGNLTIHSAANVPHADMVKPDDNPVPPQKRKIDIWTVVHAFVPAWFTVNMGTGIVSILLHNLPYNGTWLYWVSVIFFV
ncbi:sulfite transporter Ssu1 [Trichoderma gamsii]|uniref:Sulfite transporter Ssu1 n=1 Tax=Trichoderma gamsii TaxID=398673 RepID=A0A2P4Z8L4_9HYPO|nr:sulfite transporter Ssu1 [Trichoderma gamsii]PON20639.1 sulfite transporter Ssu1 [Trichoderma gamsii]